MAVYHYACLECNVFVKTFKKGAKCPKCAIDMVRKSSAPNLTITETLDNGVQTRRVERLKDIEEIMEKRSREDTKKRFENG